MGKGMLVACASCVVKEVWERGWGRGWKEALVV
jgi:hypothetical protein